MKWQDFKAEVLSHLTSDADRQGCEVVIPLWIDGAILDLQDKIPALQAGHETIMTESDFVEDGECSRGLLPEGMAIRRETWLIEKESAGVVSKKWPATPMDWEQRIDFVNGVGGYNLSAAFFPDPQGYSFMFWPKIEDAKNYVVSIVWDGKKVEFQDEEETPFDKEVALAVADYVQARIERKVNRDLAAYASFMQSYKDKRRQIFAASILKKL